jgi:hypothetical protein
MNSKNKTVDSNTDLNLTRNPSSKELSPESSGVALDARKKEMYDKAIKKMGLENKSNEEIKDAIRGKVKGEINKQGYKINDNIWNKFENITLFNKSLGRLSFQIQSQRKVTDNLDGMSFTIQDSIAIPVGVNIFSATIGHILKNRLPLSLSVSAGGSVDFMNIKQTFVGDSINFKDDYDQFKLQIKSLSKMELLKKAEHDLEELENQKDDTNYIDVTTNEKGKGIDLDKNVQARYFTTLNRIAFPLKIPLKAEWVKHLETNEIVSYAGSGGVSFGPSISLNLGLTPLTGGMSISTYLKGSFRITIMKVENERSEERVLLKLTTAKERGDNVNYIVSSNNEIYEGFTLLGNTTARTNFDIKILDTSFMKGKEKSIEMGYEFDLHYPLAREAYNQATLGMLEDADRLALESMANHNSPTGVKFLYRKDGIKNLETLSKKFQMTFLKEKKMNCSNSIENFKTKIKEENYIGITGVFGCNIFASGLLQGKLEQSFKFIVENQVNVKNRDLNKEWVFEMQGFLKDTQTNGYELDKYHNQINTLFLSPGLIPSFPVTLQKRVPAHKMKFPPTQEEINAARYEQKTTTPLFDEEEVIDYGITQFTYSVRLNQNHLDKFFKMAESEFLRYVEEGFELPPEERPITRGKLIGSMIAENILLGIPGILQVDNKILTRHKSILYFYDSWKKLKALAEATDIFTKDNRDIEEIELSKQQVTEILKKMFSSPTWGYYYQRVFMMSLAGEDIERHLVFNSSALPKPIQINDTLRIPTINTVAGDFEKMKGNKILYEGLDSSADVQIADLVVTPKDAFQFEMKFKTKAKPRYVKITLSGSNGFSIFNQEVISLLIVNRPSSPEADDAVFVEGENFLVFDKLDVNTFLSAIAERVEYNTWYKISISISKDGKKFGPMVTSKDFYLRPPANFLGN